MLEDRLRAIPFLRDVAPATLRRAATAVRPVRRAAGTLLYAAGDPAASLFVVEHGWLEVHELGSGRVLASFGPGGVIGELGVLLDAPRVASVRAVTDVALWELRREDVDVLTADDPLLGAALTRETGRRLVARGDASPAPQRVVVLPAPGVAELAGELARIGVDHIGVLALGEGDDELPATVQRLPNGGLDADGVRGLLTSPTSASVVLVGLPSDATPVADVAAQLANFAVDLGGTVPAWAAARVPPLRRLPALVRRLSVPRIARWVSGRAIGLALSSGGSKTVAHVGVVRVLRELGVEIDAVAGASGGSVVAAAVARDISDAELEHWVGQLAPAFKWTKLGPKVPPRDAMFRGTGPHGLFRTWHGDTQIADCDLPLFVVAADLATGAEVLFDHGAVADALRASMSIPGALEPPRWNGRYLIDGGIVSPLPSRILRDAGIGWVIGSDVAGQDPMATGDNRPPSLLETLARMVSTREREVLSSQVALLDVHIRPVVHAANSFDFSAPQPILEEGVRAAREEQAAIERVMAMSADGHPA